MINTEKGIKRKISESARRNRFRSITDTDSPMKNLLKTFKELIDYKNWKTLVFYVFIYESDENLLKTNLVKFSFQF